MWSAEDLSVCTHRRPPALASSAEVRRHKCLIYDGALSEQLPIVLPFLLDGLRNNWRCLYVGSPEAAQMVEQALAANGVNTACEAGRGALVISSERGHLSEGTFDPGQLAEWLSKSINDAVHTGFKGLCATGDMRWELGEDRNFEYLPEYEARLEQLFRTKPLRCICQYHRNTVPPHAIRNALVTHRITYVESALKPQNFFYIPTELTPEAQAGGAQLSEWMRQQIIRVLNAESVREKALTALRDSEVQRRRLAEELAAMNRDLERRVEERTAQLEQANRELEAFSYSVSHDLRSPLQHINGFATLLAEDYEADLDDKGLSYLRRIQNGTKEMADLISDILRLAKLAQTELNVGNVQLSVIAQNVVSALRFNDPERRIEVKIEQNIEARGDPGLLRAVIDNLLSNAWKYTAKAERPVIEFGMIVEPSGKTYFIRDNGAGFDMKYADKLFAPFQRMHRDDEFAGFGIGLATVQRIIHRHHGRIWAEAEPGKGVTFYFTLAASSGEQGPAQPPAQFSPVHP